MMRIVLLTWVLLGMGCGSSETVEAPAETTGAEQPAAAIEAPVAEVQEAPPAPTGPASVTFTVSVNSKEVPAAVKLTSASGEVAAEGGPGERFTVTSGDYDVEVSIGDDKVLADTPTQRLSLTLVAGTDVAEQITFPWANVQLNVKVNGKLDRNATVKIMKRGAVVTTVKSNREHIMISPGRYTAEVKTRGAVIEVDGLMFPEGATKGVPVAVQL